MGLKSTHRGFSSALQEAKALIIVFFFMPASLVRPTTFPLASYHLLLPQEFK